MKKLLYLVLSLLVVLSPNMVEAKKTTTAVKKTTVAKKTTTTAVKKDPVKVYIFYSNSCGFCAALHSYTDELQKDKTMSKKFTVVDYEVSSSENSDLMSRVSYYFDKKVATGVPYYVVGNKNFSGFGENSGEELKKTINEAYESSNVKDIVADIASGKLEVVLPSEVEDTDSDVIAYVILGITVVVVIAILFGRNKDEEISEESKTKDKTAKNK